MTSRALLCIFIFCLVSSPPCRVKAQTVPSDSSGVISVTSPGRQLDVYNGSRFFGVTPLSSATVDTGTHIFRYGTHGDGTWHTMIMAETIRVAANARIERMITVPSPRRITSEPSGASVFAGDSLLGVTPALITLDGDVSTLRFVRNEFDEMTLPVNAGSMELHAVLHPRIDGSRPDAHMALAGNHVSNNTSLYASAAVAVLSGIAAAHWKIRADELYDEYHYTGNEGALSKMRTLDRASTISLVASEIGLSVFTYLLLSR